MIDKDREEITGNINLTLVQKIDNVFTTLLENRNIFPKEFIESLMYVLDMLVNKQLNTVDLRVCDSLQEKYKCERERIYYEEHSKELETYKKIAQKLAEEVDRYVDLLIDKGIEFNHLEHCQFKDFKCMEMDIECENCIIDWARKEVEN